VQENYTINPHRKERLFLLNSIFYTFSLGNQYTVQEQGWNVLLNWEIAHVQMLYVLITYD
ncbi:MAG TPA: hypothetical protein VJ824_02430, partial [Bacillota bacterium]|nr:hypothetical protein [Bacillota bacterium]